MNNRYIVFLLYLCAGLILSIALVQINNLANNHIPAEASAVPLYLQFRSSQTITLILAFVSVSVLFSREGITRELKRKAYADVTGIKNKHACLEEMSILDCNDTTLNIGFALFDLNNLKKVNDFYGHEKGDELIQSFATILKQASDKKYFLGRFGGDEFIVIIRNCTEEIMETYITKTRQLAETYNRGKATPLSFACGYAISTKNNYFLMDDLLKEADKNMYKNKKLMKSDPLMAPSQLSKILDSERTSFIGKDGLTGLFNHDAFLTVVKKAVLMSEAPQNLAIISSDISNFRYINDTYGYQESNQLLKQFAKELSAQPFCLCACRLYSDNFAFLAELPDISHEDATELIKEWCQHFSSTMNQTYRRSRIIINSGLYFIRESSEGVDSALSYANIARKHTKASPLNILVYSEAMEQTEKTKVEVLNTFHNALQTHEFKLYLQPKILCSDKSICGAEALIRWQKPNGALLYPNEFIPVLEQSGDILEMDYYVYEQIFKYLHQQLTEREKCIPISMNVSRIHLMRPFDFINHIRRLFAKYPIPASLILFELTESTYIQEMSSALLFIDELHKLDIKVSMDDFGSGYSSLEALKDLPFDEIKFDKSFLISSDSNSRKILLQLMSLVNSLNKDIVCEGVESYENVTLLDQCNCDIMQGYYYFRPMPIEEFRRQLKLPT